MVFVCKDKRPTLSDLRESSADCGESHGGFAQALIRNQRKGPIGSTDLVWLSEYTTFKDMASGPQWEGLDDSYPKTQVDQEPENTKDSQIGFGYKTGDGTKKEFPNPTETDEIPF